MKTLPVFSAFLLSTALLLPVFSIADDTVSTPIEKLISEIADKPEQHQAIANYYKEKIAEANKELAMHIKMRKAYEVGYVKNQDAVVSMRNHCDKLISNVESNIKEYEALVAKHEGIATKKP
jgi:flagellar biosynthesis/type III secretory pathway protein FliH